MKLILLINLMFVFSLEQIHAAENLKNAKKNNVSFTCENKVNQVDYTILADIKYENEVLVQADYSILGQISNKPVLAFSVFEPQFTISEENDYTFIKDYKMNDGVGWGHTFLRIAQREPGKYEAFYTSVHSYMSARNIVLANMDCGIAEKKLTLK